MQKILVLGARELGLAILRSLATTSCDKQASVTVLLRPSTSPSRDKLLQHLDELKVHVIYHDLSSPVPNLAAIFSQYDLVISATGFSAGPGTQLRIAQAVIASTASWFIPWQFGVDYDTIGRGSSQPLFDEQLDVRDILRQQTRLKWTIFSTGIFTSFLFHETFGVVDLEEGSFTALGAWDNEITVTSAEDIGRVVAEVVLGEEKPEGVIYVAGDTATFQDVLRMVEESGWNPKGKITSTADLENTLERDSANIGAKYQLVWARNKGVAWKKDQSWNEQHGMKLETLQDWVASNLPRPNQTL